jgi:molybdopterin molybdotransferase
MSDGATRALTVEEALARILANVAYLPTQHLSLDAAHGRTLADTVRASLTQPPFAASAMDGYAVRAVDVAIHPARLTIVGESAAGSAFRGRIAAGQAARIFTGAPIPDGADAIVIQENTTRDGPIVTVHDGRPDNGHIRPAGGDFRAGQVVLTAGRTLDPRALMLAAASGHHDLPVRRRPRVAILATGHELVPPGATPGPDQIVSSNPIGLAALVRSFGGEPHLLGIAHDTLADISTKLALAADADIIVTTGGASVGDHDLVRPALEALGLTLDFWKLAMRPGKPMLYARRANQHVLGLPGNPVSALITARVFLCPLIGAMLGRASTALEPVMATTTVDLEANGPRQHYMRATLKADVSGRLCVMPQPSQDSSLLAALATANALIVRPINAPAAQAGTSIATLRMDF